MSSRPREVNETDVLVAAARPTTAEIAERLDIDPRRARQSISFLLGTGRVTLRTEMARAASGWPAAAHLFMQVPAAERSRAAVQLGRLSDARAVCSVLGPLGIALTVWTRTLDDVARLETLIEESMPHVRVTDRAVVLRTVNRAGNLLDETGRPYGYVLPAPADRRDVLSMYR
ncbi:hypothetical protein [Streptomyces sp. NBC_01089]|uniref:hypothetical protein n=1 Tax=Streptomyces sp. NBC_01089 TaxID=2903747 RepID=UPI00386E6799|nr:hypothetical protein OG510_26435 [Streptomyces sp. NBC_01089]